MAIALIMWVAAAVATTWKGSQLARMPRDRGLQTVTICTFLVLLALTAQLAVTMPGLGEQFPQQTPVLVEFVLLTFFFATLLGLLHSTTPGTTATGGYFEIVLALAVSAGLTATFLTTQPSNGTANFGDYTEAAGPAGVLIFNCLGNAYMAYATARGAYLAWNSPSQLQRHTRRGLRVAAVGLTICCLGNHLPRVLSTASRLVLHTDLPPGTATWTSPFLAIGVATFFIGVGYPGARTGVAKARLWLEARGRYRQLRPLWDALQQEFPTIALQSADSPARERLRVRQMRLRYYRRVIECRDGLVCLSPYMPAPLHDSDSRKRQATLVRDARAARAHNAEAAVPSLIAVPAAPGMDADARALLALSQEYAQLPDHETPTVPGALEEKQSR